MLSGWYLSTFPCSSRALGDPFLDLCEVEPDVLAELEMGNGIRRVLPGPVVDKRGRYSEQVSEFLGL
jgi:hypothetical protein